jgi:hypothetical protein
MSTWTEVPSRRASTRNTVSGRWQRVGGRFSSQGEPHPTRPCPRVELGGSMAQRKPFDCRAPEHEFVIVWRPLISPTSKARRRCRDPASEHCRAEREIAVVSRSDIRTGGNRLYATMAAWSACWLIGRHGRSVRHSNQAKRGKGLFEVAFADVLVLSGRSAVCALTYLPPPGLTLNELVAVASGASLV